METAVSVFTQNTDYSTTRTANFLYNYEPIFMLLYKKCLRLFKKKQKQILSFGNVQSKVHYMKI